MKLHITPISFADACGFVVMWHRHHRPPVGHKFSIGVADADGVLHGVAMVSRPVAKSYDDGLTLEVSRTATDGTDNANSMLYGAAWRAAKALGFCRLVTYTMTRVCKNCDHAEDAHADGSCRAQECDCVNYEPGETGSSLRAAGWVVVAERPATAGWDRPSRPREDRGVDGIPRTLWEAS